MDRNSVDLLLLVGSRGTRSFAGGILSVIISLYFNSIYHSLILVGFLFAAGAIGVPLLSFVTGRYADRYGRKRLLLLTLFLLPLSVGMLLLTMNYFVLLLSAALGGFGIAGGLVGGGVGASVAPMQSALLAEKTNSGNRTLVFSLFTMMSSITGSAGALASGIAGFRALFYVAFALSSASFVIALPIRETFSPRTRARSHKQGRGNGNGRNVSEQADSRTAENASIINRFIATGAVNGAAQGLIIPFLPIILKNNMHMDKGSISVLFAVGGLVSAFFLLATPYLTEKLGFVRFIMSSRSVASVFLLYFPFASGQLLASAAYVVFTTLRAISLPSQSSLMMNLVAEETRAYASGTNQAARLLPSASASALSGAIQDIIGYILPFELSFGLNAVNIYLYHRFFGKIPLANRTKAALHDEQ